MVFEGDFHQTLPVVPKGTHQQVVAVMTILDLPGLSAIDQQ